MSDLTDSWKQSLSDESNFMMTKTKKNKRVKDEDSPIIDSSLRKRANRRIGDNNSPFTGSTTLIKTETAIKSERKLDVYNQNALPVSKIPSHIQKFIYHLKLAQCDFLCGNVSCFLIIIKLQVILGSIYFYLNNI